MSDVISIDKTGENFCLIYDTKGRFAVHRITPEEAKVSVANRLSQNLSTWADHCGEVGTLRFLREE